MENINMINSLEFNDQLYIFSLSYGECETESTNSVKVVTVDDFLLEKGARVIVKFKESNSVNNPTLKINDNDAKPIVQYGTTAVGTVNYDTGWTAGAVIPFTYDGTSWVRDYWSNQFPTNSQLGHIYGKCDTVETETKKIVTISDQEYNLLTGGIVTIYFSNNVSENDTLSINDTEDKAIYYRGSNIINDIITSGDTVTFIYDGDKYHLIAIDRWQADIENIISLIDGITNRINTILNSTDVDLDQLAEIVAYIKSNKSLIDAITISKVNVSDIIDNLNTEATDKPLSANQGVVLKKAIASALDNAKNYSDDNISKHMHTVSHTPAGTISKPTFTGSEVTTGNPSDTVNVSTDTHSHQVVAKGNISTPVFTGTKATISTEYTPEGSVSKPTFTGSEVTSGNPSDTVNVSTDNHTHNVTAEGNISKPVFTGTKATISTEYTPEGSVSKPTFTGSEVTSGNPSDTVNVSGNSHTHNLTPVGNVSIPVFTGTKATISTEYTPEGTNSTPTFTGTEVTTSNPSEIISVSSKDHTHKVTAVGDISKPTFTGTTEVITTSKPI